MTKAELLKASIQEFKDEKENAQLWECDRVFTKSGYCYLIKKSSTPISCAFHYAVSFDTSEEIGKYENQDIAINTRQELPFEGVITYKNLTVALISQGNYNESMQQWHYRGVGSFTPISNQFLVTSVDEINENLGVNSMEIFLEMADRYPMVPSYFQAKTQKQYIMVDIDGGEDLGGALRKDVDGHYILHQSDHIKLTFVNFDRNEAMEELNRIMQESLKPDTKFGFNTTPNLSNKYSYQLAFNWKSLTYTSEFTINYYVKSTDTGKYPDIKQVLLDNLELM